MTEKIQDEFETAELQEGELDDLLKEMDDATSDLDDAKTE